MALLLTDQVIPAGVSGQNPLMQAAVGKKATVSQAICTSECCAEMAGQKLCPPDQLLQAVRGVLDV